MTARTEAGKRLAWFFKTDPDGPHRRWPRAFDARLTERIIERYISLIEDEARSTSPEPVVEPPSQETT